MVVIFINAETLFESASSLNEIDSVHRSREQELDATSASLIQKSKSQYNQELDDYQKCLRIRLKESPRPHQEISQLYNRMGLLCKSMGEYKKAVYYFKKCLRVEEKFLLENQTNLALSLFHIGYAYNLCGDSDRALKYYRRSLNLTKSEIAQKLNQTSGKSTAKNFSMIIISKFRNSLILFKKFLS